jgi:hypothetical protein
MFRLLSRFFMLLVWGTVFALPFWFGLMAPASWNWLTPVSWIIWVAAGIGFVSTVYLILRGPKPKPETQP